MRSTGPTFADRHWVILSVYYDFSRQSTFAEFELTRQDGAHSIRVHDFKPIERRKRRAGNAPTNKICQERQAKFRQL
jgi:hypothetical protein